jgi:hypothetical protein
LKFHAFVSLLARRVIAFFTTNSRKMRKVYTNCTICEKPINHSEKANLCSKCNYEKYGKGKYMQLPESRKVEIRLRTEISRKKNKVKANARARRLQAITRNTLGDTYIKFQLWKRGVKNPPQELIELKRKQLQLKRLCYEKQKSGS